MSKVVAIAGDRSADAARASLSSRASVRVAPKLWRDELQGDLATQLCVAGSIDFAHPARAKAVADFVVEDSSATGGHDRLADVSSMLPYGSCLAS